MNKAIATLFLIFLTITSFAQEITGKWYTVDEKTSEKKAVIEIYKQGNLYFGKIDEILIGDKDFICTECTGDKKNKPTLNMVIIENMKFDDDEYTGGTILDPESGTEYKCLIALENTNKLKVRGYVGFSLLGRTQYWVRKP